MLDNVWYPTSVILVAYIVITNNFGLSISFKELVSDKKLVKNAAQADWSVDSIKRWNWRKHKSSLEDKNLNKNHYYKPHYKLSLHMPWKIWTKQKHIDHHSDANIGQKIGHRTQQLQKQLNSHPAFTENVPFQNPTQFTRRKYNKISTRGYYYRWSREKASHYEYERSLSIYEDVNDTVDFEYEVKSYEHWFNYPITTPSYPNPGWHLPTIQVYYEKPYKRAKREAKQMIFWSKRRKQIEKKRIKKRLKEWRKKARELKARGKFRTKKKGDGSYRGGRGKRPRSHTKRPVLNCTVTPHVKQEKEDKQKADIKDNATNKTFDDEEYEEVEEEVTYEEYDDDDDESESNDISKTVKRKKSENNEYNG